MSEEMKSYDVVVVGSGPAGLTAALYASRANLSVLVLERGVPGGELLNTAEVENYPGFKHIQGADLATEMYDSAMQFGAEYAYGVVKQIEPGTPYHTIHTDSATYRAKAIVLATGAVHRNLNVPGEQEYQGRGVSYCAVCDGAFFKNKNVKVIGGGDSAVEEGTYLTQFANGVNLVHRRNQLRAQKILQDRAFSNDKMSFTWDSEVKRIEGDGTKVTKIIVANKENGNEEEIPADGVFIYIGLVPNTDGLKDLGITDEEGWILTNEEMKTTVPGIFAAGDVRKKHLRQISTAVGDGGIAGQGAYDYITSLSDND
ncbi:MAG: thioredoxin-disulfide reductase [Aerococcus sp.]|nr:thioredoxin-disulfide reductase [Aerococcus sp.]